MKISLIFFLGLICSAQAYAETRIAILDFELRDLTLAPGIPAELQRTASIKPMLEAELERAGYKIVTIDLALQREANGGVGYLFDHHDSAAELAKNAGADYVVVGRLHKPSFLFAYIMGHLVRTNDSQLIGNYISEIKGGDKKLTLKGVESLTVKIDDDLDKTYMPPPPKTRHK
ncbi:MAG: DUF2380 domain-containing protein [Methylobacter sp.]|nr:DUF2380 domain-containing protein [Methylobacter sp.]